MIKKGDTLVEVTIAIGIFSLIAISVASVMNSSTSGAQLSLETTLSREEIDTQAEALRFIQNTYTSDKENATQPLTVLWKKITSNAVPAKDYKGNDDEFKKIVQYHPTSCSELYDDSNPVYPYAFILNPRQLNEPDAAAYKRLQDNPDFFREASTYPRLIYGGSSNLVDNGTTELNYAEGIYVIAVKDPDSTRVVDITGNAEMGDTGDTSSAYYDFYIRTCWYGSNNTQPSTISTVMRLNDSEIITPLGKVEVTYDVLTTDPGTGDETTHVGPKRTIKLGAPVEKEPEGYKFKEWCTESLTPGTACPDEKSFKEGKILINRENSDTITYDLFATWEPTSTIAYMQEYSLERCKNEASTADRELIDRRDNNTYTVHYTTTFNGEDICWMTQDLRIFTTIGQEEGVILSEGSNFSANSSWKINQKKSGSSFTQSMAESMGDGNVVLYNFYAATTDNAGGCTQKVSYGTGGAKEDICPTGWRLPNGHEITDALYQEKGTFLRPSPDGGAWWTSRNLDENGTKNMCVLYSYNGSYSFAEDSLVEDCGAVKGGQRKSLFRIRCIMRDGGY